jgi:hypothetical protein
MKLKEKTRIGSRIIKKYDKPITPYRRVLASQHVSAQDRDNLKKQYRKLNPAKLKRQITRLQEKLLRMASLKTGRVRDAA